MLSLKNILVATDFGETSVAALTYGRELARALGARLHVVHMVEDVVLRYSPEIGFTAITDIQKNLEQAARRDLEVLLTDDDKRTLHVEPVVLTCFNVADGIIEYAGSHAIDLIITGTHGRGMVKHLILGSVAERVVRTAPCPVLTVRAHERDFAAPDLAETRASVTH